MTKNKWEEIEMPISLVSMKGIIKCEQNIKDGYLIHVCEAFYGLKEKINENKKTKTED